MAPAETRSPLVKWAARMAILAGHLFLFYYHSAPMASWPTTRESSGARATLFLALAFFFIIFTISPRPARRPAACFQIAANYLADLLTASLFARAIPTGRPEMDPHFWADVSHHHRAAPPPPPAGPRSRWIETPAERRPRNVQIVIKCDRDDLGRQLVGPAAHSIGATLTSRFARRLMGVKFTRSPVANGNN